MKSAAFGSLADAIEESARQATAAAEVEPIPRELAGTSAADLWIIEQEIEATRLQITRARRIGNDLRIPALQTQLAGWMDRRRALRPATPADPHEEERRWRDEADRVIARIEAGVRKAEQPTG